MGCGTLAALALTAAGAGVQTYGAMKAKSNMNDVMGQSLQRQKGFQDQAKNAYQTSFDTSTPQAAAQQRLAGNQQYLSAGQNASLPKMGLPSNQSNPNQAISYSGQQAKNNLATNANANLQGFNNIGFQQGLNNREASNKLGLISNQAQQWGNILPYQLQAAQQSESGLQGIGSLLGTAGTLAGLYGLTSAPSWGATANANLGNAAAGLGNSTQASPLWLGRVAPQAPQFYQFGI